MLIYLLIKSERVASNERVLEVLLFRFLFLLAAASSSFILLALFVRFSGDSLAVGACGAVGVLGIRGAVGVLGILGAVALGLNV